MAGTDGPEETVASMTALLLRDYQERDVARLRAAYATDHRAVLYQLATAGGKTVVFATVVAGGRRKGRIIAVITHRRELVKQASAKLAWAGVPHGIIAAGQDRDHSAKVLVVSIQTAIRRQPPPADLIVVDEAHHTAAKSWTALLASQPQAKLLGVTGRLHVPTGRGSASNTVACSTHWSADPRSPNW